jgi:hypothetical protein
MKGAEAPIQPENLNVHGLKQKKTDEILNSSKSVR